MGPPIITIADAIKQESFFPDPPPLKVGDAQGQSSTVTLLTHCEHRSLRDWTTSLTACGGVYQSNGVVCTCNRVGPYWSIGSFASILAIHKWCVCVCCPSVCLSVALPCAYAHTYTHTYVYRCHREGYPQAVWRGILWNTIPLHHGDTGGEWSDAGHAAVMSAPMLSPPLSTPTTVDQCSCPRGGWLYSACQHSVDPAGTECRRTHPWRSSQQVRRASTSTSSLAR